MVVVDGRRTSGEHGQGTVIATLVSFSFHITDTGRKSASPIITYEAVAIKGTAEGTTQPTTINFSWSLQLPVRLYPHYLTRVTCIPLAFQGGKETIFQVQLSSLCVLDVENINIRINIYIYKVKIT